MARTSVLHSRFDRIDGKSRAYYGLFQLVSHFPFVRLASNTLGDAWWKIGLVRRERDVICVSRIGAAVCGCYLAQPDVQNVADEVRDDRRARSTLGQTILIAGYLGQYGGNRCMQHEVDILDEKAPDSTKIDGRKEVLEINVEHVSSLSMFYGVIDDRVTSLKSVCQIIVSLAISVDFFNAILQKIA